MTTVRVTLAGKLWILGENDRNDRFVAARKVLQLFQVPIPKMGNYFMIWRKMNLLLCRTEQYRSSTRNAKHELATVSYWTVPFLDAKC